MIDPMIGRLAGCLVFGGLLFGMVTLVDGTRDTRASQRVAAAEVQQRVLNHTSFTRP
ncbi:hypothetical protein [Hansschlegelia beijingensis]|uniref:Uncharacterized protein n=1 Tax=Hansschlegelia beijingensis TaxID=1133344 RepID=A0A7W6CVU8_9HYPH|nr:hypothetical protein [Hansschlegelia beijingensis]MBB3972070.1 hypothetical protein [Hansschlegelia beijingensis]